MKVNSAFSNPGPIIGALIMVMGLTGCNRHDATGATRSFNEAEKIWIRADYNDPTNAPQIAYRLLLSDRDELTRLQVAKPNALNYHYSLAIINSRLFLLARSLGKTNEAEAFRKDSSFHFQANLNLPTTELEPEEIEAKMARYDAQVHPERTNATSK